MCLMATAFGQNGTKYAAQCKSYNMKHAAIFKEKCWRNRVASFGPFTKTDKIAKKYHIKLS